MKLVRIPFIAAGLLAITFAQTARATPPSDVETTRRAGVVARVGTKAVTVGELEDRMAAVPRFQLAEMGADPLEVKRRFLENVVLPELLLDAAGEKRSLASSPTTAQRVARARASATLRAVRQSVPSPERITPEEVKAYYEEHRARYEAPERIAIWRILVSSREEAQTVIDAAKKDLTVTGFTSLARDKSIDKATHLRAGNLGFVDDEGVSNEAGLRVEPAVVRAAKTVKDGELVPAPVAEGANFAIVWRRGTVKPNKQTLAEADDSIRAILARRKVDEATTRLIEELKKTRLAKIDTELVRTVELPSYLVTAPPRASAKAQ